MGTWIYWIANKVVVKLHSRAKNIVCHPWSFFLVQVMHFLYFSSSPFSNLFPMLMVYMKLGTVMHKYITLANSHRRLAIVAFDARLRNHLLNMCPWGKMPKHKRCVRLCSPTVLFCTPVMQMDSCKEGQFFVSNHSGCLSCWLLSFVYAMLLCGP